MNTQLREQESLLPLLLLLLLINLFILCILNIKKFTKIKIIQKQN